MTRLTPWPIETIEYINEIFAELIKLEESIVTCQHLIRKRYQAQIEVFVPDIEKSAMTIIDHARAIQRHDHRPSGGRTPKWADSALEIRLLAEKIITATDYIRDRLPQNRWSNIAHLLTLSREIVEKIENEVDQIPLTDIPLPFLEALKNEE